MRFRFPLLLLALVLAPWLAHAQQQERTLEERIMRPDMAQGAREQTKAYSAGKSFSTTSTSASKSFFGAHSFSLKSFFTRSYLGDKKFSSTQYNLDQKAGSNLTKSAGPIESGKVFATSAVPVSTATGLTKSYTRSDDKYQTAQAKVEGKSQKSLDLQHSQKPMSIDEVRDLLNKNK